MRRAEIRRQTKETDIVLELNLDGSGEADVQTGVGFLDHMLVLLARHGLLDLRVRCTGDLHVDQHHTVEDVGICLGRAIQTALDDRRGIRRYGQFTVPMDECLVLAALDLSGRGSCHSDLEVAGRRIGEFDAELAPEFFRALAVNAGMNLHLRQLAGGNGHHLIEAAFKAFARALEAAVSQDPRVAGIPSTKGTLSG